MGFFESRFNFSKNAAFELARAFARDFEFITDFLERDRHEIGVEDVAIALTLALDLVQREDLNAKVRLEVSAGFGAWLEWLLKDEATQARLLRAFEAGARVGLEESVRQLAEEDVYSSYRHLDVCSGTNYLWRFVSARLVAEARRPLLAGRLADTVVALQEASDDRWEEILRELLDLALRWRSAAWLGRVYPLAELTLFGGRGHLETLQRGGWR